VKKFFIKFSILFLSFILSGIILNLLYTRTNYWKTIVAPGVEETIKFKNVPKDIQLANVGSSHGLCSFDYSNIPYKGFNFALSGQYFLYDYAILKQYVDRFSGNAVLLIPISYFQITRIKSDFQDQRARYYSFLRRKYMDFYSIQEKLEKLSYDLVPVLTAGDTFRFIFEDVVPSDESIVMTESELIKYSIKKHESWTTDSKYVFDAGKEGFIYNKSLVSQIIEFCYVHDIRPVLLTTPVTSVLNSIYNEKTPDFFDDFYRFINELQEVYPSLPYFDYSNDPRFENDFSLFRDGDHLNKVGAEKFTGIIITDLQASGLLP